MRNLHVQASGVPSSGLANPPRNRVTIPPQRRLIDVRSNERDLDAVISTLGPAIGSEAENETVFSLGEQLGTAGIGIADGLEDLTLAYRILLGMDAPAPVTGAFSSGWVEGATGALLSRGALDQMTGLATIDYLATRLRDLARLQIAPHVRLVAINCGTTNTLRLARIAFALLGAIPNAETPVHLGLDRIGVLVRLSQRFDADYALARITLGRELGVDRAPLTIHEVPVTVEDVSGFIRTI